jgi:hypothetical protein
MFWDQAITEEEEEDIIEKTAEKIHEYGMETPAILFLESSKPLVYIGGEMGRFFIMPFIPAFSEEWGRKGDKLLRVFEKRDNIEKLIVILEEMAQGKEKKNEKDKKPQDKDKKESPKIKTNNEKEQEKKNWFRRLLNR